jgi:hypothetical protein
MTDTCKLSHLKLIEILDVIKKNTVFQDHMARIDHRSRRCANTSATKATPTSSISDS